jgi:hypothetical protein
LNHGRFIIVDPQTGAGAYLIDGGANGGYLHLAATALASLAKIGVSAFFVSVIAQLLTSIGLAAFAAVALAVLATRLPWSQLEAELAPIWQREARAGVLQRGAIYLARVAFWLPWRAR